MRARCWMIAPLLALATLSADAGVVLEPRPAPEWQVSQWINGDPGRMSSLRGKVVLIEFFQLWCPGCNSFSIPLFQRWNERYAGRDDVVLVSIHTVFEGHELQTPERLREFVREKGIEHSVGIDAYDEEDELVPVTMRRFATRGTPHVVIVDKQGDVRFSNFGSFDPDTVEFYIERLLGGEKEAGLPLVVPAEEPTDPFLSGHYVLTIEQTEKSCGPLPRPFEVPVRLQVFADRIRVRSEDHYFGFRDITLSYDALSSRFSSRTRRRTKEQTVDITVAVELDGRFARGAGSQLQFEAFFTKEGDIPGLECEIELRGSARRISD